MGHSWQSTADRIVKAFELASLEPWAGGEPVELVVAMKCSSLVDIEGRMLQSMLVHMEKEF